MANGLIPAHRLALPGPSAIPVEVGSAVWRGVCPWSGHYAAGKCSGTVAIGESGDEVQAHRQHDHKGDMGSASGKVSQVGDQHYGVSMVRHQEVGWRGGAPMATSSYGV
jgi:hypothetical protein